MSKKHFVRMAAEFKTVLEALDMPEARAGVILAIEAFMRMAEDCNGRFDRDRFRRACGLEG
jgi:hypothetical protein